MRIGPEPVPLFHHDSNGENSKHNKTNHKETSLRESLRHDMAKYMTMTWESTKGVL